MPDRQPRALTYLTALQDFLVPWLMPTPRKSHSSFCYGLVFMQSKALTDVDSGASLGSGSPQAGLSPSPAEPVAAPQIVSTNHAGESVLLTLTCLSSRVNSPALPLYALL